MSMSDTISDLLTRLRNAQNSSKENVSIPFSKNETLDLPGSLK